MPLEWHTVVLFVGCAVTAMFVMNGISLWVTLLAPRKGNYDASFGNDLSFAANVVVMGAMFALLFGPRAIAGIWPHAVGPEDWWKVFPLILIAVFFYFGSLKRAETMFLVRREALLALMEGRA